MIVSRNWLQKYFDQPLPSADVVTDAFTFHSFEIEEQDGDRMDVKVLPNRAADCLCHRGIAKDLAAILDLPFKNDPLRTPIQNGDFVSPHLRVEIEDGKKCLRYVGALVKGVKIGPSPMWLREAIEAVGQRSINNIVDATNFVMLNIGQPMHAFDATKLVEKDEAFTIGVRGAKKEEKITTLSGEEFILPEGTLLITDENADIPIGIAGVKGGMHAEITSATTDIVVESANFDCTTIRRAAQALKLPTEASLRFQNRPSPELAAYGMRDVLALIQEIAGGEVIGVIDVYPTRSEKIQEVSVSLAKINGVLGVNFSKEEVADAFRRLDLDTKIDGETFTVTPSFERNDIQIPEDLIEEVGRIVGYDKISAVELPPFPKQPEVNPNFYAAEHEREDLISKGYSEVFTSVFADKGERVVTNKVDGVRPYLRTSLIPGLEDALLKNARNKDLLGLKEVKLFDIGTVWKSGKEVTMLATIGEKEKANERVLEPIAVNTYEHLPTSSTGNYQTFSKYPFIVRDIAMWVPAGTEADDVLKVIRENSGELLVRSEKFDEFRKNDKVSYAFRLLFQSFDRTLFDEDANARMENVNDAVKEKGWEVR